MRNLEGSESKATCQLRVGGFQPISGRPAIEAFFSTGARALGHSGIGAGNTYVWGVTWPGKAAAAPGHSGNRVRPRSAQDKWGHGEAPIVDWDEVKKASVTLAVTPI